MDPSNSVTAQDSETVCFGGWFIYWPAVFAIAIAVFALIIGIIALNKKRRNISMFSLCFILASACAGFAITAWEIRNTISSVRETYMPDPIQTAMHLLASSSPLFFTTIGCCLGFALTALAFLFEKRQAS